MDYLKLAYLTIGSDADVRVVRVVVVQRTVCVHVTHIVGVGRIRRTEPRVACLIATTLLTCICLCRISPMILGAVLTP